MLGNALGLDISLVSGGSEGESNDFVYKTLIFAIIISTVLPLALSVFAATSTADDEWAEVQEQLDNDYYNITGDQMTNRSVWALTGIYTPYDGGSYYGYTSDGWIYGTRIVNYAPSQYPEKIGYNESATDNPEYYSVTRNSRGYYEYTVVPASQTSTDADNSSLSVGDVYTMVSMDVSQKSTKVFTSSGKTDLGDGEFYYEYTGYRYAFQPLSSYYTTQSSTGEDGTTVTTSNAVKVVANTTSLSLVWYQNPALGEGISGQLVLSGSDDGVNYITLNKILMAFDNTTSTANFEMVFNGITMDLTIRINPYYLAQGESIKDAWDNGHWSIMVSSASTDVNDVYQVPSLNLNKIVGTIKDLLTFNMKAYGFSGWVATLVSLMYVMPLGAALLTISLKHPLVMGIIAIGGAVTGALSGLFG